jgi:hypothetical protein
MTQQEVSNFIGAVRKAHARYSYDELCKRLDLDPDEDSNHALRKEQAFVDLAHALRAFDSATLTAILKMGEGE